MNILVIISLVHLWFINVSFARDCASYCYWNIFEVSYSCFNCHTYNSAIHVYCWDKHVNLF